jgi:(1->4)-alpha-D-glucan 1-alpha-D-glucosylmutase
LQARRRYKELFAQGRYLPVTVTGQRQRHVVAFARVSGQQWCLTIVPRFPAGLVNEDEDPLGPAVWSDTQIHLPAGTPVHWRNALTDASLQSLERLSLGQVLAQLPVAMLIGEHRP